MKCVEVVEILVKRAIVIAVFMLISVAFAAFSHAASLDEMLTSGGIYGEDAKHVKDLYGNLTDFGVNKGDVLLIIDYSVKKKIDSKKLLRIMVLISKTALADIPTEALTNKILEGFAKGALVDVIIKEAESKVLTLKNAKAVLNYFILKGYKTKQPDMAISVISMYLAKGWTSSSLKREVELSGLSKKEFSELSLFLRKE